MELSSQINVRSSNERRIFYYKFLTTSLFVFWRLASISCIFSKLPRLHINVVQITDYFQSSAQFILLHHVEAKVGGSRGCVVVFLLIMEYLFLMRHLTILCSVLFHCRSICIGLTVSLSALGMPLNKLTNSRQSVDLNFRHQIYVVNYGSAE